MKVSNLIKKKKKKGNVLANFKGVNYELSGNIPGINASINKPNINIGGSIPGLDIYINKPGVEFDNDGVIEFVSEKARALSETILQYKRIVFEGHSTDYQTPYSLRKMVESGVFILKVGPELTFAYREALTGMEKILNEINGYHGFSDALLTAMNDNDANWHNHYVNNAKTLQIYQQYSFSDRCRYYLGDIRVKKAIEELKDRFNKSTIPLFLVHQFLPFQYCKIRDCNMKLNFDAIVDDMVSLVLDNYRYASGIDESRNFYV